MIESSLNPQVTRRLAKHGIRPQSQRKARQKPVIAATRDGDPLFRELQEIAAERGLLVRTFPSNIRVR